MTVMEDNWDRIEDAFRVWSFGVFYKKTFKNERHPLKRFVKALLASAQPIKDRHLVIDWWHRRQLKRDQKRVNT